MSGFFVAPPLIISPVTDYFLTKSQLQPKVHYIAQINPNEAVKTQKCAIKSIIMHQQDIIETLKKRRITLQVNQETLAMLSGVGLRTVKQFESRKGNPTLETIQKLADVLGLEMQLTIKKLETENEDSDDIV
jgi:DNA-binding XRE family transcriptional regulator